MLANSSSQSAGSSVHRPDGQSSDPIAVHWALQLTPRPHLFFCVFLVSGKQQVTSLVKLAVETALSKASIELTAVVGVVFNELAITVVDVVVVAVLQSQ